MAHASHVRPTYGVLPSTPLTLPPMNSVRRVRRRPRTTHFYHLSDDLHVDIVLHAIARSDDEQRMKLPSLLLSTTSPFLSVPAKLFRSLDIVRNIPSGCTKHNVTLDLQQDKFEFNFVLRNLLPQMLRVSVDANCCTQLATIRTYCRAFQSRCVNVKDLDICISVLPSGPPSLAILLVRAIGTRLTKISLINHSHRSNWDNELAPLANTIGSTCKQLERFDFEGHYADAMKPVYRELGDTLKEISVLVLSGMDWHSTLGVIRLHCRKLTFLHINSALVTKRVPPPSSRLLQQLFMSYESQLLSVNLAMIDTEHISALFTACPNVQCSVTYGERWHDNELRMDHLCASAPRLCELSFGGVDTNVAPELLSRAMKRCVGLESMMVTDIQSNIALKALFSARMSKLRCVFLSMSEESLTAATLNVIADNTCNLRSLELLLENTDQPYQNALYGIAASNPHIERLIISERESRTLSSCIQMVTCLVDFLEKAERMIEIIVEMRPPEDTHVQRLDKLATLLLPFRNRRVCGYIEYNYSYKL